MTRGSSAFRYPPAAPATLPSFWIGCRSAVLDSTQLCPIAAAGNLPVCLKLIVAFAQLAGISIFVVLKLRASPASTSTVQSSANAACEEMTVTRVKAKRVIIFIMVSFWAYIIFAFKLFRV